MESATVATKATATTATKAPQLNLNLGTYSLHQILRFFGYIDTDVVERNDLLIRSASLKDQLVRSGKIPATALPDLDRFINDATRWIEVVKCAPPTQYIAAPSSVIPSELNSISAASVKENAEHNPQIFKHAPPPIKPGIPPEHTTTQHILPSLSSLNKTAEINNKAAESVREFDPALQPAQMTASTTVVPGIRNPLHHPTIKRYITIDSRARENYYNTSPSDFTVELPEKITRVIDMQLTAFEIPLSFYNVSADLHNHYFHIRVTFTNILTSVIETTELCILVPDGNYNALDLIQAIQKIVAPRNDEDELTQPNSVYSYIVWTVDITASGGGTGKVSVAALTNTVFQISGLELHFGKTQEGYEDKTPLAQKLGWMLGFQKREYVGSVNYISDSIVDPGSMRYMYLAVDDYQRAVSSAFIAPHLSSDILARITVKGTYFSLLMADNLNFITEPRRYFGPVGIRKLRIRLYDEWGRLIPMNAANFSLCITFTVLYDMAI